MAQVVVDGIRFNRLALHSYLDGKEVGDALHTLFSKPLLKH